MLPGFTHLLRARRLFDGDGRARTIKEKRFAAEMVSTPEGNRAGARRGSRSRTT
jgi:hypothetical protein